MREASVREAVSKAQATSADPKQVAQQFVTDAQAGSGKEPFMKIQAHLVRLLLISMVPIFPTALRAATPYALATGSVFDQNGAPLSGATARLINASIGFSQGQSTNSDGVFTFPTVPPAEGYIVATEMSGFATEIRQGLKVTVGEVKMVLPPFLLKPITSIEAQASSEPGKQAQASMPPAEPSKAAQGSKMSTVSLDPLSTTLGGVIDTQTVHTLPLGDRDFIDLALLVPGTYPVEQGSVLQGASMVVNGVRANMNNFLLDGADDNDYSINQSLPFQIVEALQEFRVQTSTSAAEYGRSGGAQINSVSRRGSNALHGELFGFNRNSALSANNFFSVYNGGSFAAFISWTEALGNGDPLSDPTLATLYNDHKPPLNQNQFGGNLGGALKKNRLFGFSNWESFRLSDPRPIFEGVPGTLWRTPQFIGIISPNNPNVSGLYSLYPTPNVPKTNFTDPTSAASSPLDGYGDYTTAFFVGDSGDFTHSDNFLERVDWVKSDRASMSLKYNIQHIHQVEGGSVPASPNYPGNGTELQGRNQNFSLNHVQQFSRASNELRLGWNRFRFDALALDRSMDPASLGFTNLNFPNQGLPTVLLGGPFPGPFPDPYAAQLGADLSVPSARADNVWSVVDNLGYTHGRNYWKFGGEYRYTRLDVLNGGSGRGLLSSLTPGYAASSGLFDFASIARVAPGFGGGFDRSFRTHSLAGFVQDQWHRSNSTLNYGLHYEVNTAPIEARNRLVNFYPNILAICCSTRRT